MALLALPKAARTGSILVRADSAGATHAFVEELHRRGLEFSIGFPIEADVKQAILAAPPTAGCQRPTSTATSARAPGFASFRGWTLRAGRRGPGRSAAGSGPTPAPGRR